MSKLQNQIALITGGGSGIGLATAQLFLREGATVVIAGRDRAKLDAAVKTLQPAERCHVHSVDIADAKAVAAMVKSITAQLGRIDILVNNAGTNIKDRTFRQLTIENWDRLIRTNLDGAFYCIHAVLPQMFARKNGVIINVSSTAGKRANPLGGVAYDASKFGMTALGMCLGAEEKDSGVRVSNVYPGEVDTPILEVRPTPVTAEQRQRILKPEDVAEAVLFVATLPPHVSVPELIIKPTAQMYI